MTRSRRHIIRPRAFTLVELLVVLVVMVIVAAAAAPRIFSSLATTRLRAETQRLLAALQYAQGMAALQRTRFRFHFNLDDQSYYVTRDPAPGDDFELEGTGSLRGPDYFPGPSLFAGSSPNADDATNASDRVDIFDADTHSLPRNVLITKIIDPRGDEISSGSFSLVLDPLGTASQAAIYLTTDRPNDPLYVIRIGANGIISLFRDDQR